MKYFHFVIFYFCIQALFAQNCLVLNQNVYAKLNGNCNLVVNTASSNGIITTGTGGNIISESEFNVVKWNVGTATGSYTVPFTTNSFVKIPLTMQVNVAGTGAASSVIFSTYETGSDNNLNYPSDVTNMNSNCNTNNGLYATDRFWIIDAGSYSTKPTVVLDFGYDDAVNEMGGTNTITESNLKAERFNASANSWETPQKLYGIDNAVANKVNGVNVVPADFFRSWTLIDTAIMTIPLNISGVSSSTICSGDPVSITPSGATSYTLMPGGTVTGTTFTVMPNSTTVYTISGAIGSGTAICKSYPSSDATVTINVNTTPTVAIASVSNNTICSGQNSVITPSGASNYTLMPTGTVGTSFTVTPTSTSTYTIVGESSSGCLNSAADNAIQQIVVDVLNLNAVVTDVSCNGYNDGVISVTAVSASSSYTYTWSNSATTTTVTNLMPGNYSVTVVNGNNCTINQNFAITEPGPIALTSSTLGQASCNQNPTGSIQLTLTGGSPQYQAVWSNGNTGLQNTNIPSGVYTATVTDANNCMKMFSFFVDTLNSNNALCVDLFIPEIFTPNGNGKNDLFVITKIDAFPNNTLSIYNRWGNIVYQKKEYKNDWNGKPNVGDAMGTGLLPSGTYFVVFDFGDGESKPYNGYLELQY